MSPRPGWQARSILLGPPGGMHAEEAAVLHLLPGVQWLAHKVFLCSRHMYMLSIRRNPGNPLIYTYARWHLDALAFASAGTAMGSRVSAM